MAYSGIVPPMPVFGSCGNHMLQHMHAARQQPCNLQEELRMLASVAFANAYLCRRLQLCTANWLHNTLIYWLY